MTLIMTHVKRKDSVLQFAKVAWKDSYAMSVP